MWSFFPHISSVGGWCLRKQSLPFGILGNVGAVVEEHLKLNLLIALAIQQILNVPVIIRADLFRVLGAVSELPLGCIERQEAAKLVTILLDGSAQ